MISQYEASVLNPERTILETQSRIGGSLTARIFAICVGALAALVLLAAKTDRQAVPPAAAADMAAVIEDLHAAAHADGRLAPGTESSPPIFLFGFVEFDWNPAHGGVPGFGPLPLRASRIATVETE
jgi:hypothetical protein